MFRGQRDGSHVHVPALFELSRPSAFRIGLFPDDAQIRAGSGGEERTQLPITLFGDLAEAILAAARMLTLRQAERGGVIASALEHVWITHARHDGRGRDRTNALDSQQPARRLALLGKFTHLPVIAGNVLIEFAKLPEQSGEPFLLLCDCVTNNSRSGTSDAVRAGGAQVGLTCSNRRARAWLTNKIRI